MIAADLPSAASAVSSYQHWYRHFLGNRDASSALPWGAPDRLTATEVRVVSRSIQQFQVGEWARGRGLMRRAASHPTLANDPWFLPALQLFIAEEQQHSRILGRFLDRERIPRLTGDGIDWIFRRLRKLAGLELCTTVLVTAEVLAIPFYQALRDATHSPLLRSICVRILCDEVAHLKYQALTLGQIRRSLGQRARSTRALCHSILFDGTALLVWRQHRRVFRAAGWDFRLFWRDARAQFGLLQRHIRRVLRGACIDSNERRLD
jgi:hypothetical protein